MWCPLSFGETDHLAGSGGTTMILQGSSCPSGTTFNSTAGICEDSTKPLFRKELGSPKGPICQAEPSKKSGDPINSATGNLFESEVDYEGAGAFPLRLVRYYNSQDGLWRHSYSTKLTITATDIALTLPDGKVSLFSLNNGIATPETTELGKMLQVSGLWTYVSPDGDTFAFDTEGRLSTWSRPDGYTQNLTYAAVNAWGFTPITVTDDAGRTLTLQVDSYSRPQTFAVDGLSGTYTYNALGDLTTFKATWSGGSSTKQYLYEITANPTLLTGTIDELGIRSTTWTYDDKYRATSSASSGGVDYTVLTYNSNGSTTETNPLGHTINFQYQIVQGVFHITNVLGAPTANCPASNSTFQYDTRGQVISKLNGRGFTTTYQNDAQGLVDQTIEASGTSVQRTTNFTWDNTLRVPLTRAILDNAGNTSAYSSWIYNSLGQATARCEADPNVSGATSYTCGSSANAPAGVHQWRTTYCNAIDGIQCPLAGLPLSTDGPRTDVSDSTSYSYYMATDESGCASVGGICHRLGDLYQVTNALGQKITFAAYDKNGRLTRETDTNGVVTDLTYYPRGWLHTKTVHANADGSASSGDAIATLTYTAYGAVASIQDADGVTVTYGYDAAHRLTDITDAAGDRIHYTLDAAGNKTQERTFDPSGTVRRTLSRAYNTLGQLTQVTDGLSHAVFNATYADSYDANGNLVHTADGLGVQRKQGYDGLNRLVSTIDNYNGTDTATQNTQSVFAYDANDRLEGVGDPDGLNTTYSYDGLGNATGVQSPDTGGTTYVYDAAGNVTQRTDAKGVVSSSTYDALNRRTATTYADGTLNVAYGYDEPNSVTGCPASYPTGRLTRIIETAVTTVYCYDAHGNITRKSQTQGTVTDVTTYGYTLAERLASTLTPSGTSIQYSRDAAGRISGITALPPGTSGAGAGNVVTAISYLPFGPIASYTLGNGQTITRTYDANYALTDVVSPALNLHFARDAMGNITALGNAPGANPATETYSYDPLYRLTGLADGNGNVEEAYTYSKTGDRLSKTASGLATGVYTYQTGTHHLASIGNASRAYDADGNTTGSVIGGSTFGYGYSGRNRMTAAQRDGSTVGTYTYNALGQRTLKAVTVPAASSERFAYDEGSQLVGEYGSAARDYIWLGDLPVAVVDTTSGVSTVNYVHADGLSTPRAVADATGASVWQLAYQGNAFGEQQPSSASGYSYNLRFPGQYFDVETGLNYNGARYYESTTGQFPQPDPSGINGGMGLYVYGLNNPLLYFDPDGQQATTAQQGGFAVPVASPGPMSPGVRPVPITDPITGPRVPSPVGVMSAVATFCGSNPFSGAACVIAGCIIPRSTADSCADEPNPPPGQCPRGDESKCNALYATDTQTCNGISRRRGAAAGAACHASASERYAACLRGAPIPPLNTWNN